MIVARKPKLAVTMGDPAGIGPEIIAKILLDDELNSLTELIFYGCPGIILAALERFAPDAPPPPIVATGGLGMSQVPIGAVSAECGLAALAAVAAAVKAALSGEVDAVVTAPMNKASVNAGGVGFTGHTEFIAGICGVSNYAMLQSAGDLRVVFVTTHIPLTEVAAAVSGERIVSVAELLTAAIREEGISRPRLAVAAINPHAGEDGHMGMEDETIVKPAITELRRRGFDVDGPFPPDTLFIESIRSRYDGIVSMYHDQGHIPFKMLAFDRGVNSTLGLPIIRTSVDHGTAFDIAWRGVADTGSLTAAVKLAARRAAHRSTGSDDLDE